MTRAYYHPVTAGDDHDGLVPVHQCNGRAGRGREALPDGNTIVRHPGAAPIARFVKLHGGIRLIAGNDRQYSLRRIIESGQARPLPF